MKGDFSRDTYDKSKDFLRVLMQQGRVHVDADWNEQTAIFWDYLRTLAVDLGGKHGGDAFKLMLLGKDASDNEEDLGNSTDADKVNRIVLRSEKNSFYYVDGFRCRESSKKLEQELWKKDNLPTENQVIFLDVWERHITYQEDDSIREKALGGADTASRSKLVCMPRSLSAESGMQTFDDFVELNQIENRGCLSVALRARSNDQAAPCIQHPNAKLRGSENQLYRIEIHSTGRVGEQVPTTEEAPKPTWKWARDNASVSFPVRSFEQSQDETYVVLEHLGRDSKQQLQIGDFVELVIEDAEMESVAPRLLPVTKVNKNDFTVTLGGKIDGLFKDVEKMNPRLRKWSRGALPVDIGAVYRLENGIEVQFHNDVEEGSKKVGQFKRGDYWLIPARIADGTIEWPLGKGDSATPARKPPRIVEHHYAPIAFLKVGAKYEFDPKKPRKTFPNKK